MTAIIVKNYAHINRSFPNWDSPNGRIVKNKDHYDRLMKENGMVSYETMQQKVQSKELKNYVLSDESREIIKSAKNSKDKRGNVKLSDKTIDAMVKKGLINKKIPNYMKLPNHYGAK